MTALPDDAVVVRGGQNLPESFVQGSGVTIDASGKVEGVSVNAAAGRSVKELTAPNAAAGYPGIPHNQVGVTTVGKVRALGGDVVASPRKKNPHHATLSGFDAETSEQPVPAHDQEPEPEGLKRSKPMSHPRVYADFQNLDDENRLRLTCAGTRRDLERQALELREGLVLTLYTDDATDDGQPDELMADGVVHFNDAENCWVAAIDWQAIRHASAERKVQRKTG